MGARRSRAEWEQIIRDFEASGDELASFCRRRRLRAQTLAWWRWRIGLTAPAKTTPVRLLPVEIVDTSPSVSRASVVVAIADIEVRLEIGTDPGYVAALVAAIRAAC